MISINSVKKPIKLLRNVGSGVKGLWDTVDLEHDHGSDIVVEEPKVQVQGICFLIVQGKSRTLRVVTIDAPVENNPCIDESGNPFYAWKFQTKPSVVKLRNRCIIEEVRKSSENYILAE